MSTIGRRTRQELETAKEELEALRQENLALARRNQELRTDKIRLEHETRLAYLEGMDQGRAMAYREVC